MNESRNRCVRAEHKTKLKLETEASSRAGQCIPAGYCHAHMLLYESGVNYNVNGKYVKYFAQLCVRIFTFWNISTTY